ncbi:MAG: T9SS type A sorting domain-containing protein [Bacteroidales bacterium]|nr:T9SS type A sorting domain-containing protein [Bacteroidales bacterium]MCF8455624.1 T9SS type A sorting domain-containing protein [Bacteroidales bacterium]
MKSILLSFIFFCITLVGFSQTRSLPSTKIQKAHDFVQTTRSASTWDFNLDFEDNTVLGDLIFENLDSLQDHPDVSVITNLNFYDDVWLLLEFSGESNNWMGSNSYFSPAGQADRWMIIPNIPVTNNAKLLWKGRSVSVTGNNNTHESYEVYITSGTATTHTDFSTLLESVAAEETVWASHEIDLASWINDTVSIAFRHTSTNQEILGIDDVKVGIPPVPQGTVTGTFEEADDFSLDLTPWITIDMDSSQTYGISNHTFPHSAEAMSFIAFNPDLVSPPLTSADPHSGGGSKYGACFAAVFGPNDDWLISPKVIISESGSVRFYARSYSMQYALETFRVLVSTGNPVPSEFSNVLTPSIPFSTLQVQQVDTAWTYFEYDLSAWSNVEVHVAIQCVSNNSFIFLIDDIEIDTIGQIGIDETAKSEINLFPNPVSETLIIENARASSVEMYNSEGRLIRKEENIPEFWKLNVSEYSQGIYRIRIIKNEKVESFPVMILH